MAAQGFTSKASYVMHAMPVSLSYLVKLLYMVSEPMVVAAWLASPVMHSSHKLFKRCNSKQTHLHKAIHSKILAQEGLEPDFLLHRGLQLFQEGKLPVCADGRLSAGPLDLPAFLAQASLCLLLPTHFCPLLPRGSM